MMHIRPIQFEELAAFVALHTPAEHIPALRDYVDKMLSRGSMQIERCFVVEDAGQLLGRLAYWTLPSIGVPHDIVLLDLPWTEDYLASGTPLLQDTLAAMRKIGAGDIGHALDVPAMWPQWQHFPEARHTLLSHVGFTIERETRRFERTTAGIQPTVSERLVFRSFTDVGEDVFLNAVERISASSFDQRTRSERAELGAAAEARKTFLVIQSMDYEPDWWQLAYTVDGTLVGLSMPTRNPTYATIGYIGVVPEQRGRGYINDLLAQATMILAGTGADVIRTDTDVANFPMANAFRRAGYTEFAHRREYILRGTTN